MLKILLLLVVCGLAHSEPDKIRIKVETSQTPASTEKLHPLIAPLPALAIPRIAVPLAIPIPQLAYAYAAPVKVAAIPSTYTVEQNGYTISYT